MVNLEEGITTLLKGVEDPVGMADPEGVTTGVPLADWELVACEETVEVKLPLAVTLVAAVEVAGVVVGVMLWLPVSEILVVAMDELEVELIEVELAEIELAEVQLVEAELVEAEVGRMPWEIPN